MHINKDRDLTYSPHSDSNGQYFIIMDGDEPLVDLKVDNIDAGLKLIESLRKSDLISDREAESLENQARASNAIGSDARLY